MTNSLTLKANAKLNIYLFITGKRPDGYHDIDTEMQEIDLFDTVMVSISGGDGINIRCDNPDIPVCERNIAYKAASLFKKKSGTEFCCDIKIQKRIPIMAGLGGSSTDAGAVLKALNQMHDNILSDVELLKLGTSLGADVPFSIIGGRAKCSGIGDIITPLSDHKQKSYAIIKPSFSFSTKKAFAAFADFKKQDAPLHKLETYRYHNTFSALYNDARIDDICNTLIDNGASYASMTGSGSAVFGIFESDEKAKIALNQFESPDFSFRCIAHNLPSSKFKLRSE